MKPELQEILRLHNMWVNDEDGGERATLRGADLTGASLRGADLTEADLTGASLEGADLEGAYLTGASLRGAYLTGASLEGAYLTGASLRGAYLTGASLEGADLTEADLTEASLRGAYLRGADLTGADLTGAKGIASFQAGEHNRVCYAVNHEDCVMFQLGCFWGDSEQAIEAIRKKYGENSTYERLVLLYTEILGGE